MVSRGLDWPLMRELSSMPSRTGMEISRKCL